MRSISATSVSSRSAIQYRCLLEEGGKPFMPVVSGIFYKIAQEDQILDSTEVPQPDSPRGAGSLHDVQESTVVPVVLSVRA